MALPAALFLPALAYADHDNGKGNDFENRGTGSQKDPPVTVVPEANTGIVLIQDFVRRVF
jgi:hypothetical protein